MAIINKAEKQHVRESLRKNKMFPYFVYFPKGGGLLGKDPILEFQKTKAQREKRVNELKSKYGNKFSKGICAHSDEETAFQCVRKPIAKMEVNLEKIKKIVPEMKVMKLMTLSEAEAREAEATVDEDVAQSVSDDINDDQAVRDLITRKVKNTAKREEALQQLDRFDRVARAVAAAEHAYASALGDHKALTKYAKTVFGQLLELNTEAKGKVATATEVLEGARRDAQAPYDPELDEGHGELERREAAVAKAVAGLALAEIEAEASVKRYDQMTRMWGAMSTIRSDVRTHIDQTIDGMDGCVKLRGKVNGPKTLRGFVAALDTVEEIAGKAQGEVYKFQRQLAEMHQTLSDLSSSESEVEIDMPTRPSEVVGKDPQNPLVPPLVRFHSMAKTLLANPWHGELTAKKALIGAFDAVPVPDVPDGEGGTQANPDPAGYRRALTSLAVLSKASTAKITSELGRVTTGAHTAALRKKIEKKGTRSSIKAAMFLQGVREFWNGISGHFSIDYNGATTEFAKAIGNDPQLSDITKDEILALKPLLGIPDSVLAASVATVSESDGTRSVVKLPESGRVAVVGGGPIGLMAAIEAVNMGTSVTLFEGRSNQYTRENVLKLQGSTIDRLEGYGVYNVLGLTGHARSNVKVKDLEDSLFGIAQARGIRIERGKGVGSIELDLETHEMILSAGTDMHRCKLVVIAVGAGVAAPNKHAGNVVMSDELGIDVKAFGLSDHVVSANFEAPPQGYDVDGGRDRTMDDERWKVVLDTDTDRYVLTQIEAGEFERIKNDEGALREFILRRAAAQAKSSYDTMFRDLDLNAIGRFKVTIQRAEKFTGVGQSVLVGDAAGTPHPEAGSGTNTGAMEITNVSELVRGLVVNSRARFEREDELGKQDLETYDERMEDIVGKATKKGIANMLSVRKRALTVALGRLRALRRPLVDALEEDSPHDANRVKELIERIAKAGEERAPKSTDPVYDDWEKAKTWGTQIEVMDAAARTAVDDANAVADQGLVAVDRAIWDAMEPADIGLPT